MKIPMVCVAGCLFAAPLPALAVSIDEFGVDTPVTTTSVFTDGGMVGGERDVILVGIGAPAPSFIADGGLATFSASGPSNGGNPLAQLVYDGNDDSTSNAFGLTGVDLTTASHDRFLVSVSAINGPLSLQIRVWESGVAYSDLVIANIVAQGIYEFEYASFVHFGPGANFADAKAIGLFVTGLDDLGGGTPNPRTVTIDFIRTRSGPVRFADGFEDP